MNRLARVTAAMLLPAGICLSPHAIPAARAQEQYAPGIWHYRSVACANTTVKSVQPRLTGDGQTKFTAQDFETGVEVVFNTHLGNDAAHPALLASVTVYGGEPGAKIMQRERPGDPVQVCFLSRPAPTIDCNPDEDVRGRVFRVYDFKQHAEYSGQNFEHGCGGA